MRTRLPILLLAVVAFFQASALSAQTTPRTYVFGSSCGGAPAGTALISIDPTTVADLGDTLRVRLTGAPPNISVALNLDTKLKASNGTPTQLKRFKLASPSCVAQVSPYTTNQGISHWTTTNANGEAYIDLRIPDHSSYDGVRFNMQWMMSSAVGGTQAMTVSDAISTVIRQEIVLRSVIGPDNSKVQGRVPVVMSNTAPGGNLYYSVPVPIQSSSDVKLKRIRLAGANTTSGASSAPGSMRFHAWSSLANAITSYSNGDVFNGWIPAVYSSAPFGNAYYGQAIQERIYNVMSQLQGLSLSANTPYYLGLSVETAGFSALGVLDTLAPSCPANTLVGTGQTGGTLIAGSTISSGCVAIDVVATAIY